MLSDGSIKFLGSKDFVVFTFRLNINLCADQLRPDAARVRVPDRLPVPAGPHLHLPGGLQLRGEVRDRARLRGDRGRVPELHRGRGGILGGARQLPDEYQGRSISEFGNRPLAVH